MNLVTGGAGHLGNVLARELVARGEPVRVLILPGEDCSSLEGLPVEKIEGNILNYPSLLPACRQVDTIFHMAGLVSLLEEYEPVMRRVNVEGTRNVIRAAQACGARRLVYTSSIHALTRPPSGIPIDENLPFDPHNPAGPYDRTKAEASLAIQEAVRQGLDAIIVCPTGVIGPYDFRRSEIGEMILAWMAQGLDFTISGRFDFVDVRDIARGHLLARDAGKNGETYILGGEQIEVLQMRNLVKGAVGDTRSLAVYIPRPVANAAAAIAEIYYRLTHTRPRFTRYSLETLASHSPISSAKARSSLGYSARALAESIADTVTWWLENRRRVKATVRI